MYDLGMRLVESCFSREKLIGTFPLFPSFPLSPPLPLSPSLSLSPRHTGMFSAATILVLKKMPFTWLELLCRYRWLWPLPPFLSLFSLFQFPPSVCPCFVSHFTNGNAEAWNWPRSYPAQWVTLHNIQPSFNEMWFIGCSCTYRLLVYRSIIYPMSPTPPLSPFPPPLPLSPSLSHRLPMVTTTWQCTDLVSWRTSWERCCRLTWPPPEGGWSLRGGCSPSMLRYQSSTWRRVR